MISSNSIFNNLTLGAQNQMTIQTQRNSEIASGRKVGSVGENPLDYKTSLNFRHLLKAAQDNTLAATEAQGRIKSATAALTQMITIMQRIDTIRVGLAPGANLGDFQGAKTEVETLRANLVKLANTQWRGDSVFSGTEITKLPFTEVSAGMAADPTTGLMRNVVNVPYAGNAIDRVLVLSSTQTMSANVRGDAAAFADTFASIEQFVRGLDHFIAGDVTNGDAFMQSSAAMIATASDGLSSLNSNLAGKLRAADAQLQIFQEAENSTKSAMDNFEGADLVSANAALQQSSTNLQIIYSLVGRLDKLSLINYI
ncbi:MAG: hypothetical protein HQM07_06520 [Zetaproteobacteria bacterium]|nr:hypothetical protein [Zetaproteobacteria bacterium]